MKPAIENRLPRMFDEHELWTIIRKTTELFAPEDRQAIGASIYYVAMECGDNTAKFALFMKDLLESREKKEEPNADHQSDMQGR